MGLIGALGFVAFLYFGIIGPLTDRGSTVVIRHEPKKPVETPAVESDSAHHRVHQSTRAKIIERVPEQYPLFLKAAEAGLAGMAEECGREKTSAKKKACLLAVEETTPEEFAWGLVGHWRKENGMCLGTPEESCDVSSTGARGPMQFMPGTWKKWGRDGNGDGIKNPEILTDSAYAAAAYLCHLRKIEGSWGHAMCRYYGDNVPTCLYERRVRRQIGEIKTVLVHEEERKRLEAATAENPKPSMTLSKVKSASKVR